MTITVVNDNVEQECDKPVLSNNSKSQWIYCPNLSGTKLRLKYYDSIRSLITLVEVLAFEYYAV